MNPAKTQIFSDSFTFPVRKTKTDKLDSRPKNTTRQNRNKQVTATTPEKLNEKPRKKSAMDTSTKKPITESRDQSKAGNQRKPDTQATTNPDLKEYDGTSNQTTERKEYRRIWQRNRRHEAKKNGL